MIQSEKNTLIMIPGFLCDEAVWSEQVSALEPYANIIIPAFKGMQSLREVALQILNSAPEQFSLIGHSLGGRIALEILHLAESRVDKVAIMDTGVHPVQSGERQKRRKILERAKQQGMEAFAKDWVPPMISASRLDDIDLVQALYDMTERFSVEECEKQINISLSRNDQSKYLPKISKHVLLICGDEDTWSPVAQHVEMQKALSDADLQIIKNCGHMTTMEKPQEINDLLITWFNA